MNKSLSFVSDLEYHEFWQFRKYDWVLNEKLPILGLAALAFSV